MAKKTSPSGKKVTRRDRETPASTARVPVVAPGSPEHFRARVRMYRQGLGDCFLITLPREGGAVPFQMLIDCGALARDSASMRGFVAHIRDTVRGPNGSGKARLDVVVGTHEHKDHLSGFNQARQLFDDDFEFGEVWLPWTENLDVDEIKSIKSARRRAVDRLRQAINGPRGAALADVGSLLGFDADDDEAPVGSRTIADALAYLKRRGRAADGVRYFEPGDGPIGIEGVAGARVFVLGPPRDPILLKGSEVTDRMKREHVVYHLGRSGGIGLDALTAALDASSSAAAATTTGAADRYHPFAAEHRLAYAGGTSAVVPAPIGPFVHETYASPTEAWRRIDDAWLSAFGQLALDLDSDTNNTSLVLAIEFPGTREVLLFVGDAQGPPRWVNAIQRTAIRKVGTCRLARFTRR